MLNHFERLEPHAPTIRRAMPTGAHAPAVIRVRTRKGGYNRIINRPAPKMPRPGDDPVSENTSPVRTFTGQGNGRAVDPLTGLDV